MPTLPGYLASSGANRAFARCVNVGLGGEMDTWWSRCPL